MGSRCGLVAYQQAGRMLLLLVLPKMWRPGDVQPTRAPFPTGEDHAAWKQACLAVVAYEGDAQEIVCPEPWETLLKDCINCLTDRVTKDLRQDKDDPRRAEEATLPPSFRHLLVHGCSRGTSGAQPYQDPTQADGFQRALDALLALTMRSGAWKHGPVESTPRDDGLGALFRESEQHTGDPLCIMAAQYFVSEVAARAREVRQGYVETTEMLPLIRGRLTARGMTTLAYSGVPLAECTYDDFTPGVLLFRVIVTALDRVASGAAFPSLLTDALRPLCGRALVLRHTLAHIPSLPAATAAFEARRCRLGPLLRAWQPVLDVARLLLREDPLELSPAEGAASAHTWVVETPKVWEGILASLAEGALEDDQSGIPPPWSEGVKTRVDLRLIRNSVTYLVDAKYKEAGDKKPSPSISDLYQMFAYTHLASGCASVRAALVYPALPGAEPGEWIRRRREPEANANGVTLRLGRVVFPSREACETDDTWERYRASAQRQFEALVYDVGAESHG